MLHIWMPEASGIWHWTVGEYWQEASTLEQLLGDIHEFSGQDAVVFFPSRDVHLLQQSLPKAQYKKMGTEAAQYLLEEHMILPIDQAKVLQHFEGNDQLFLLGISQHRAETLRQALALLTIKMVALLPDFMILPCPRVNQTVIVQLADRILLRESEWMGQSIDDLNLYLDYQTEAGEYLVSGLSSDTLVQLQQRFGEEHVESFQYQLIAPKKPKLHPWNILPKVQTSTAMSGYVKACAAVLLAIVVVQFGYDALRWANSKKLANQTAQQAIEQYQSWFGRESRVTEQNIKSQFESHLRLNQNGNTQAFALLSQVGPLLMQHQIVAQQVKFESQQLSMQLKANSTESLQALTQQLKQQGLQAELGSVQAGSHEAIGQVHIQ